MKTTAGIYCRISDDRTGEKAGVKRQEADCRVLAKRRGWAFAQTYIDNDLSAYSGKPRPEYRRMLEDLGAGRIQAIVAWHPDRLHRSVRELEDFIDVVEAARVAVATVQGGDYDLTTASGRSNARIVGVVARGESERKAERQLRKHEELAAAGKVSGGGDRPFGFGADRITVRPEEGRRIREAVRKVLRGGSLRGIVTEWNAAGVLTTAGKPWRTSTLTRMLKSARIAGWREHHGKPIAKAEWPAIISRRDSDKLRTLFADPSRRLNLGARRYLLTGFVRCGLCGGRLNARPRADKRRSYVCASGAGFGGCGKIRVLAEPFEELVVEQLLIKLDTPQLARAIEVAARTAKRQTFEPIEPLEAKLSQLASDFAGDRVTRTEWLTARDAIEARIQSARGRLAREHRTTPLEGFVGHAKALENKWPALTIEGQRGVLGAMVSRIAVGSAVRGRNRFDGERVSVEWRL